MEINLKYQESILEKLILEEEKTGTKKNKQQNQLEGSKQGEQERKPKKRRNKQHH